MERVSVSSSARRAALQRAFVGGLFALALAACSDDNANGTADTGGDTTPDGEPDMAPDEGEGVALDEDACEHFAEGPFDTATASADANAELDEVSEPHFNYTITLADLGGGDYGGFVSLVADEDAEFALFFDGSVDVAVTDAADAAVEIETTNDGSAFCTEVGAWYVLDLELGTYTLELGPVTSETVGFVLIESGAHGHE